EALEQLRALGLRVETEPWSEVPRSSWKFPLDLARNLLSPDPYNAAKDFDPRLRRRAEALLAEERPDLVICDFVQMARNVIGLPGVATLLFQHNVEAEIFERHSRVDRGWLRRRFMGYQAAKMRWFEGWAGRQFDAIVAVSERDLEQYRQRYGWEHATAIDTAVDIDYYQAATSPPEPRTMVFVGSLDWMPNEDGLEWFADAIWPLVRQRVPDARIRLVGRRPGSRVQRLAAIPGIELVGEVPDTRPEIARSAVVAVPLRIGGGTRLKIFEAMASGRPVVSTSLGAEGLQVTHGRDILLADTAEEFASAVSRLLESSTEREQLATAARRLVEEKFSSAAIARQFEAICLEAVRRHQERSPRLDGATR
ncbi:MAG: glycosyltransferase family 4 protein, partial [Planctomycetaceae bacterium]